MPGRTYLANYQNRRLNEVVIPGAHDAGVYTANRSNVQTQALDIAQQADAGCRFFDLRIAAQKTKVAGVTTYTHRAYHLDNTFVSSSKVQGDANVSKHQTVAHMGGWGGDLITMLDQARVFVRDVASEFLILKFSKCYNWADVARACVARLGAQWYTRYGNLNNRTVQELAGHVVTIFDENAREEINPVIQSLAGQPHGILFFRELFDKKTKRSRVYDPSFSGLQYFGKFSNESDIDTNTRKQTQTLTTGAATHMDVIGMMYWTTTGVLGNIRERDTQMWTQTNVAALQQTWQSGLQASIESRFGREANQAMLQAMGGQGGALGGRLKSFMPNVVMMDFVDLNKCNIVEQLNNVAGQQLQQLMIPRVPPPVPPRPAHLRLHGARPAGPPPVPPRPAQLRR